MMDRKVLLNGAGLFVCYIAHDSFQEKLFRVEGFKFGLFATAFEIAVMTALSALFMAIKSLRSESSGVTPTAFDQKQKREPGGASPPSRLTVIGLFVTLTVVLTISQGAGTAALQHVRMPVKVGFKCAKLIPTMLFGLCLTGRRYSLLEYGSAVILCSGLALMSLADYFDQSADVKTQAAMVRGVQLLLLAVFCDALVPNVQEKLLGQLRITMDAMVFWSNLAALAVLIVSIMASGELGRGLTFAAANPTVWSILATQAVAGYCGLCCYLGIVRSAGGVMGVVTTSARKGFTLCLSYLVFDKPFGPPHAAGMALLVLGLGLTVWSKQAKLKLKGGAQTSMSKASKSPLPQPFKPSSPRSRTERLV